MRRVLLHKKDIDEFIYLEKSYLIPHSAITQTLILPTYGNRKKDRLHFSKNLTLKLRSITLAGRVVIEESL